MKEYLKKNVDGVYELIKCVVPKDNYIKVPEEAEAYVWFNDSGDGSEFYKENFTKWYDFESKNWCNTTRQNMPKHCKVLWERSKNLVYGGGVCDMFIKFPNKDWEKIEGFHLDSSQVTKVVDDKVHDMFVKIPNKGWKKLDSYPVETYFSSQYKHLIGVQFNKNIYSFRECSPRYVHAIGRDMDRDVCVIDQYEIYYKLRDVEFYVSDEHNDTMSYQQYSKFVSI